MEFRRVLFLSAETAGDDEDAPDVAVGKVGPQQGRDGERDEDEHAPMVGVPFLVSRCPSGPSLRIGWPSPCRERSHQITAGPMRKALVGAVTTAPPLRQVERKSEIQGKKG